MKPEEMIVNNWYLYKPLEWVFMFEQIVNYNIDTNVHCYNFYIDVYNKRTRINVCESGIVEIKDLNNVVSVNIEDYMHLFDINSLPSNNPYKINHLRKKKIKSLLSIV